MWEHLAGALTNVLLPMNLFIIIGGVMVGIVIGAIPGLTATMALALLIPFTFAMPVVEALLLLGAVLVGSRYGGAIPAILLNIPGTPADIATTLDGYPLSQKGKAEHALVASAFSSTLGAVVGGILLLFMAPLMITVALSFGPPEYFWVAIFGLTIIATLASKSIVKGLMGGAIGLLLGTIGIAPLGGDVRFTFGFWQLQGGLQLIVALIGFFCVPEIFNIVEKKMAKLRTGNLYTPQKGVILSVVKELLAKPGLLIRSSGIGMIIGIIPGTGGNISALVAYNEAVRFSKTPEEFGKGNMEGVTAAETSTSSEAAGSMVPMLTLGIPGSPPTAIIMGALMIHGLRPGPHLFEEHAVVAYTFILSLILGGLAIFFLGCLFSRHIAKVINIPVEYLAPVIFFMCVIGTYAIRNNMIDVFIMVGFGIIGYVTSRLGFHPGPIVLGLILGTIAETALVQSILLGQAQGNVLAMFFGRPISAVLIVLCVISATWPFIAEWRRKKKKEMEEKSNES